MSLVEELAPPGPAALDVVSKKVGRGRTEELPLRGSILGQHRGIDLCNPLVLEDVIQHGLPTVSSQRTGSSSIIYSTTSHSNAFCLLLKIRTFIPRFLAAVSQKW